MTICNIKHGVEMLNEKMVSNYLWENCHHRNHEIVVHLHEIDVT